jgi:hypothetical protein
MEQSASDKNAIWLIIVISGLVQISSLIDRAYFTIPQTSNQSFPPHFIFDLNSEFNFNFSRIFTITGTVFLIAGTYSVYMLSKYWENIFHQLCRSKLTMLSHSFCKRKYSIVSGINYHSRQYDFK